jgi:hypothetical protein
LPLQIPTLDNRRYQELLDEALARIPVHNPQWTNFNKSDPGVTLIEIFAFLTENLLYRSNQIPERNRRKFLSLLGVPLQPASSARGLVTFINERGPLQTLTLNEGLEVRAGQVPFRTERGLDVLPIEAQVFYKRKILNPDPKLQEYYKLLYSSYNRPPEETEFRLYESVPLDPRKIEGVDLGQETVDGSLWIALLLRSNDKPPDKTENARTALLDEVRDAIAGKTLSLGIVPVLTEVTRRLVPAGPANPESATLLQYQIPNIPGSGGLPTDTSQRNPRYKTLEASAQTDVLAAPGIVDITLPPAAELRLWNNLEPLEPGAGDFPPALEDTNLGDRLITWLRISATVAARARLLWVGINAVFVTQRTRMSNEVLPNGTGAPDQVMVLARKPVVPESVRLTVTTALGETKEWKEIEDLFMAGPEVKVPDLRSPPGAPSSIERPSEVFTVNPESGEIKFGDGMRGKRPPAGAIVRASYDYGVGAAGNVGEGAISNSPSLPAGLKVSNPVRTWNGTEAETVNEGEKQITRYLQHRDRLVSAKDFETITWRTPGVDIGRVEVIPAFNPALAPNEPGGAPGAVTLMLIPRFDPNRPAAPKPDRLFLDTVCRYLDPRRLVTTELFLRGPDYKDIWISVGINVVAGAAVPTVREAVKRELLQFLAPFDPAQTGLRDDPLTTPSLSSQGTQNGWPLRKAVTDRELLAVASRVSGVLLVNDVKIAEGTRPPVSQITMNGLELPRVAGISVTVGEPFDLDQLRGQMAAPTPPPTTPIPKVVPVPVVPEEC